MKIAKRVPCYLTWHYNVLNNNSRCNEGSSVYFKRALISLLQDWRLYPTMVTNVLYIQSKEIIDTFEVYNI